MAGEQQNIYPNAENTHERRRLGERVALKENVKQARILYTITEICSNPGFLPALSNELSSLSDIATAPQPLDLSGPMVQGYLMTIGIPDGDVIHSQALLMNMREVPSYYDSRVNSSTLDLRSGAILCGKGSTCQPTIDLLPLIVKAGSMSVRLVFESRAKCQDCVARYI